MDNDTTDTPSNSLATHSNDAGPDTNYNYNRWMTQIALNIAHMKMHQLAIPGAHNAGVDLDGKFDIGLRFGACQYKSFPEQLAAGARYLDLRLVDSSYKKTIGNKFPTYKFIEVFEFKHGPVSAGRSLDYLITTVKNFTTANPGEIVFLDFHHYDKGANYSYNSLERCLPKFNPIKDRLIPPSAKDLSIAEIRQKHPGCSIILALAPGPVDNWPSGVVRRDQLWSPLPHAWREHDSDEEILSLTVESMIAPLTSQYWVLSAATSNSLRIPQNLSRNSSIRIEAFKAGYQNVKTLMVNFIESEDSRISVVDRCIELNIKRSVDTSPPTIPTNFVVTPVDEDIIDGERQNTLRFTWNASTDNLGMKYYEVFRDGVFYFETGKTTAEKKNLPLKNYSFAVRAIDNLENKSDFASFELIQDKTPPTLPENLRFGRTGFTSVVLEWEPSFDEAGVESYEIYKNGKYITNTTELTFRPDLLDPAEKVEFSVRAKDMNGLYSEYTNLTLWPRPRLINPRISIIDYDDDNLLYTVLYMWDIDTPSQFILYYVGEIKSHLSYFISKHIDGVTPSLSLKIKQGELISFKCSLRLWDSQDYAPTYEYDVVFEGFPPSPIPNLKLTSQTPTETSISWTPSTSKSLTNQAISLNEGPPILILPTVREFVFEGLPIDEAFTIEIWVINAFGATSTIESITFDPIAPSKPGIPQINDITHASAEIRWAAASGLEVQYKVSLNGYLVAHTNEPRYLATHLKSLFDYHVEIRAFNSSGVSEPTTAAFKTLLSPPANLRFSHVNGNCRLAWDPVFSKFPSHEVSINDKKFTTVPGRWGYNFRLSDLSPGPVPHHFKFAVRAHLDGASSEVSLLEKTLADGVPPSRPGAPDASEITDTSVYLAWEPSSDNVGVAGYRVVLNGLLLLNTPYPYIRFTALTPGAHHYVFVRAKDADGNLSCRSAITTFKTTGQAPFPPPVAPVVNIVDQTSTSVKIGWYFIENSDTFASGVRIMINDEFYRDILFALQTDTLYELIPGNEYKISVSSFDMIGQLSEPVILTYEPKDTTAPSVPGNPRITDKAPDSITLAWEASTDDIGVCEYALYNDQVYFDSTPLTQYSVTGLMPGSYSFEVRALDYSGNASEPAKIAVEVGPPPAPPTNFRFTRGLIPTLEWDAPDEPVTGYQIILTGPQGTDLPPYDSIQPILKPVLLPLTRYQVRISARNAAGYSLPLFAEITT